MPINENVINAYLHFASATSQTSRGRGSWRRFAEWLAGESDRSLLTRHMSGYDRLVDEGIRSFRSSVSSLPIG